MDQVIFDTHTEFDASNIVASEAATKPVDSLEGFRCTIGVSESDDQEALCKVVFNKHENYKLSNSVEDSDIVWFGRPFQPSDVELIPKIKGFFNRICGTEIFRDKDTQCWILNQCKEFFPEAFNFHPGSFCLMKDYEQLQREVNRTAPNKLWIAKPSDGGDGDGIFLFKTMEELHNFGLADDMVVQQYIGNPLTLRKKKWDARVYVMIHGINPMRAYISTDCGLGRFCTEDYDTSDTANIFSHLTNYSINRKSDKYVNNEDENANEDNTEKVPTKVSLSQVWKMIKEEHPDVDIQALKQKVIDISADVIRSSRSAIEVRCAEMLDMNMPSEVNDKFFHILGLDIMFDDNFDAWLFETNRFPSMDITLTQPNAEGVNVKFRSTIDEKIKGTLCHESFKILVGKQESQIFTKFYDSSVEGSEDAEFFYEKVFKIYRNLSGPSLKDSITIADFYKLMNLLSPAFDTTRIDLESVIQRLRLQETTTLSLIDVFNGLKYLAEDLEVNMLSLLDTLSSQ